MDRHYQTNFALGGGIAVMRSPILVSLTITVSITMAGSAMAQSLRPNMQQNPPAEFNPVPGAFYSGPNPYQAPVTPSGYQGTNSSLPSNKIIDASKAVIDASNAINDLTETLNTVPPTEEAQDENATLTTVTESAPAAVQQVAQPAAAVPAPPDSAYTTPSLATPTAAAANSQVASSEALLTTGSEAPPQPVEQINPWRVPNTAKVYDDTGRGIVTKTQELIQSLGIEQQVIATPTQEPITPNASAPQAPVSATAPAVTSPIPVFAPVVKAPVAVVTPVAPAAPIAAVAPVASAAAPLAVVQPQAAPIAKAAPVAPAQPEPTSIAATELSTSVASIDPGTPADCQSGVGAPIETAVSGAPVPINETASLITAPPSAPVALKPVVAPVVPAVQEPDAKTEVAKTEVEEKQSIAEVPKETLPPAKGTLAKLSRRPLLISRGLKAWSSTPVEDWSDPSSVSTDKIKLIPSMPSIPSPLKSLTSSRKGIEHVGRKIASLGHVKNVKKWGATPVEEWSDGAGHSNSQVAAKPPKATEEKASTAPAQLTQTNPAEEKAAPALERINTFDATQTGDAETKTTKPAPDAPGSWY